MFIITQNFNQATSSAVHDLTWALFFLSSLLMLTLLNIYVTIRFKNIKQAISILVKTSRLATFQYSKFVSNVGYLNNLKVRCQQADIIPCSYHITCHNISTARDTIPACASYSVFTSDTGIQWHDW